MAGRDRSALDSDELRTLAVVRLLEIAGEAAKAVSPETQTLAPGVPWRQIGRTRDRLIHGYFNVDLDIVRRIVSVDLPPLLTSLRQLVTIMERKSTSGSDRQ